MGNPIRERLVALAFIIVALILLTMQSNLSFLILFPILLLTFAVSWYLYKEIQRDNEESLKRSIKYMREEAEAQQWLHKSFVPKARKLAQKELASIIIGSGIFLICFIFLWSFFVSGLFAAITNTIIGFLFFVGFIVYTLYAPKEFTRIFRHVPRQYRHHSKNDWVHAYLLLFPFAALGIFLYSLTTIRQGILGSLFQTITLLISYTFIFIAIYCVWYLYNEIQKETEEELKKTAKKILQENHK